MQMCPYVFTLPLYLSCGFKSEDTKKEGTSQFVHK